MTAIIAIAAIAGFIWGTLFMLRGSVVAGCLGFLLTAVCLGHHFASFDMGPIPLTIDRVLLLVLLATYLVQRRFGRTDPKPVCWADGLVVAFLGVLVFSGFYGGWFASAAAPGNKYDPIFRLVAGYTIPVMLYWMARQASVGRREVAMAQGFLAVLGVYLATTGILEITGQWWAVFPKYIADPTVGIHFGRARGPMCHSVSYGLYMGICTLALWLWQWRFGRVGRLVIFCLMPLMLAAIYYSYTRSVWMGTGLGLVVALGLTLRGAWRPLVVSSMVAGALLVGIAKMDSLKSFDREQSAEDTGKSVDLRGAFAYISWQMFLDRPMLGVGFGQFPEKKLPYLTDRGTSLNLEATRPFVHHNMFLSILTETGLIGFAVYLGVLSAWGWNCYKICRHDDTPDWAKSQAVLMLGALAVYIPQVAFHELSYSTVDNVLIFFLAGLTMSLRPLAGLDVATTSEPTTVAVASPALSPR